MHMVALIGWGDTPLQSKNDGAACQTEPMLIIDPSELIEKNENRRIERPSRQVE